MIKRIINTILGREQIYIVRCSGESEYPHRYYAVEAKTKTKAIRRVIEQDPLSRDHIIEAVIKDDIYIARDETYYVNFFMEYSYKHLRIMAPEELVKNIIKYKYNHSSESIIYVHKIEKCIMT